VVVPPCRSRTHGRGRMHGRSRTRGRGRRGRQPGVGNWVHGKGFAGGGAGES
jgi:hypothetical protein